MAEKKSAQPQKATLDKLLSTVERGFADLEAKMERGFAAVAEDITDIKSTMATKDDIAELKTDSAAIRSELRDIKARLKEIDSAIEDHAGHSKEIDHALERISAIKRHLGINKKTAA
jgi:predicted  nucleic acid-binding Zn-ribbon protein